VGHRLLDPGEGVHAQVLAEFGKGILQNDQIDRGKLAAIVFSSDDALARLNAIVHPAVFAEEREWFASLDRPGVIAIVEAAILIETGNYRNFDCLVVTWCPEVQQITRARERSGWSEAEVRRRMARQIPSDAKKAFADFVIDTSGSPQETRRQTLALHARLVTLEKEKRETRQS
jgi:dephospho-CoA kinase